MNTVNQYSCWSSPNLLVDEPDKSCGITLNFSFLLFSLFHLYGRQIIVCCGVLLLHLFECAVLCSVIPRAGLRVQLCQRQPHSWTHSRGINLIVFFCNLHVQWCWDFLCFIWGPRGCTLAYSQLCVLNHFSSQCSCRELRGICLGDTKPCEHPSSVWGFTKDDASKRGKPSLLEPSAGSIWLACESSHAETLSARGQEWGDFGAGGD